MSCGYDPPAAFPCSLPTPGMDRAHSARGELPRDLYGTAKALGGYRQAYDNLVVQVGGRGRGGSVALGMCCAAL